MTAVGDYVLVWGQVVDGSAHPEDVMVEMFYVEES